MMKKIYKKTKESLRAVDRLTMILACIVLVFTITAFTTFAAEDDDGEGDDVNAIINGTEVNISYFSGLATNAFNDIIAPTKNMGEEGLTGEVLRKIDENSSLGTIGNLLGLDADFDDGADNVSNVFGKGVTGQTTTLEVQTVTSWYEGNTGSADGADGSNIIAYIMFGSALNDLGIDEIRNASNTSDGIRMIIGYATYVCYVLAYSAANIMSSVLDMLSRLNIFMYIYEGIDSFFMNLPDGAVLDADDIWHANKQIKASQFIKSIKKIYISLKTFRWVIFGWIVILFVASITIWKSKQMNQSATTQTRLRNILFRVIIMCIGLPLAGMVYTECLAIVSNGFGTAGIGGINKAKKSVTDYIYSGFMDFENWVVGDDTAKAFSLTSKGINDFAFDPSKITIDYDQGSLNLNVTYSGTNEPVDASRFTYAVNESIYTSDYTSNAGKGKYIVDLWEKDRQYQQLIEQEGQQDPGYNPKKAYEKARDLILAYAQGNTVNPDVLNRYYMTAYDETTMILNKGIQDTTDENEKATLMGTMVDTLFGVNSANQRIWSYLGIDVEGWYYPGESDGRSVNLSESNSITAELIGYPLFPKELATSGVFILNGPNTMASTPIMQTVLCPVAQENGAQHSHPEKTYVYAPKDGLTATTDILSSATDGIKTSVEIDLCDKDASGMSALAIYNYLHTSFDKGAIEIYPPQNTSNEGVSLQHYSVTTPYKGIPEIINLLYTVCIMFSIGIIGWVFGVSLLMNTLVQTVKALPLIFKMMVGSIQGFVESLLIVFSICIEMIVTVTLYTWSIQIIDFVITFVRLVVNAIIGSITDAETTSIVSGMLSMCVILWATFELIKWRRAITISIKSIITHVLNQLFGVNATMPTGANGGALGAVAGVAAGAMVAGSLAENGTLDDVVNDLTNSDLGSSISENLQNGDLAGAADNIKSYAGGTYRGKSETAEAEAALGSHSGGDITTANATQSMTDDQNAQLADMDEQIAQVEEEGRIEDAEELRNQKKQMIRNFAHQNYAAATSIGVADYGDYLRGETGSSTGTTNSSTGEGGSIDDAPPVEIEGANIPAEPSTSLDANGNMAYTAAKEGDVESLRTAAGTYDKNGLTSKQASSVSEMVVNGASEEEVAAAIDGYAQDNFGDNAQVVIDKINEAAGRSGGEIYGNSDNSSGNARTMSVNVTETSSGSGYGYDVTGENGTQQIEVQQSGGAANYINTTAGGASAGHMIQTVDMGQAENGTQSYGQIYNNTSQMIMATGGNVSGGFGSVGTVTTSEMSAQISVNQMTSNGVNTVSPNYGNSNAGNVQMQINQYAEQYQSSVQPVNQGGNNGGVNTVSYNYNASNTGNLNTGNLNTGNSNTGNLNTGNQFFTQPVNQSGNDGGISDMMKFAMISKATSAVQSTLSSGEEQDPNATR